MAQVLLENISKVFDGNIVAVDQADLGIDVDEVHIFEPGDVGRNVAISQE